MEGLQKAARRLVFERFAAAGAPPSAAVAAADLDVTEEELLAAWRALDRDHQLVLGRGGDAVRMAHPFSAEPMGFVLRGSGDRMWWGGCAWDSFGIVAAIGETLEIVTRCPACGRTLSPSVGIDRGPPPGLVVRLPRPAAEWWDDVIATCSDIRLCCDAEHARAYAREAGLPPGEIVAAERMWRLALGWYGDRLDPDYEPQGRDARMKQLADAGLTGPFWDLP